jgi:hypothetical protein
MKLIPVLGRANCIEAKELGPISLLHFMEQMMAILVSGNIKDEKMRHVPYSCNNLPMEQLGPQKLHCTMRLHI